MTFNLRDDIQTGDSGHPDLHNAERRAIRDLHQRGNGLIYAQEYGVVADGATDTTVALQTAIDATGNNTLVIPPGAYKFTDTIIVTCNLLALPGALLSWNGPDEGAAVQIGRTGQRYRFRRIQLPLVESHDQQTRSVGVKVFGVTDCRIDVPFIGRFGIGLLVTDTDGQGTAWNRYDLGFLLNNGTGVRIRPEHSDGWVNQNLFVGGRIMGGGLEVVPGTRQISIEQAHPDGHHPDENNFYAVDVESLAAEYHLYTEGSRSTFDNLRFECGAGCKPRIRFAGTAFENVVRGGGFLDPSGVQWGAGTWQNTVQPRGNSIYLQSPDQTLWRIVVTDAGALRTTQV